MSSSNVENLSGAFSKPWLARGVVNYRKWLILLWQGSLVVLTYYCSFLLRQDFQLNPTAAAVFWRTVPLVLLVKLIIFYEFGLLSGWWRYVGMSDLMDISKAALSSSSIIFFLLALLFHPSGYPRSVPAIDFVLTIFFVGGSRFIVRAYTESVQSYAAQKRTLVIGAGQAGSAIVRELKRNPTLDFKPIGFVDDDGTKQGIKINGVKVLGTTEQLGQLIDTYQAACVLIAIPSGRGQDVQRIISKCRRAKVEIKILPPLTERIQPRVSVTEVRSVQVEDILGRKPVPLEGENISQKVKNKVLLITGAGGSIGSELARQAANFEPQKLVLLDRSENDLFKLASELSSKFPDLDHVSTMGDILDVNLLRDAFARYRPHSVFHAAAYKHVPMMEMNCFQAVSNNIFGTYNVALIGREYQVEDFVLISSDKAVKPSNIMGVTKRVAELIVLGLQRQHTKFMAVRFGNVIGSNGSVFPIFERQIANGGPVTVTHPDVTRFFMTIREAVELVLQASTMGDGGEIFVLDMGQPVRILDLARNVIRLSGFEPDREIKIVFTGLRPGEKLAEELMFNNEGLKLTSHEKISVVEGRRPNFQQVRSWLEELSVLVESKNVNGLVSKLHEIVPEYSPSAEILSLCEIDRHDVAFKRAREGMLLLQQDVAPVPESDFK